MKRKLTRTEIRAAFDRSTIENTFPPILDIEQLSRLMRCKKSTIYAWNSQGKLDFARSERGRKPLFWRDDIVVWLFGDGGA